MIIFNIVQNDHKIAEEISNFVIEKKFALYTHIDTNELFSGDGTKQSIRLFFITKALLYDIIEEEISAKFKSDDLMIYATPVIHISKKLGDQLRYHIKAI
ncbi:MAG: hypothetical protein ACK50A_00605 [Sphingobacteriaceae bacterium]|jgi:hypothetical protein